jgi:WD40 repeat protein
LIALKGLLVQASIIAFSTDEHFICGGGSDGLFYVWDVETGEVVTAQKFPNEVTVMQWVEHRREHHYTIYDIVLGYGNVMVYGTLSYVPEKGQWALSLKPFTMPPGGSMVRSYLSSDLSCDGVFIYVGTAGGEVLVFRRDTGVFRACIPVCTNGVQGIVTLPNGELACGGGDGSVCILQGHDMSWRKIMEVSK